MALVMDIMVVAKSYVTLLFNNWTSIRWNPSMQYNIVQNYNAQSINVPDYYQVLALNKWCNNLFSIRKILSKIFWEFINKHWIEMEAVQQSKICNMKGDYFPLTCSSQKGKKNLWSPYWSMLGFTPSSIVISKSSAHINLKANVTH